MEETSLIDKILKDLRLQSKETTKVSNLMTIIKLGTWSYFAKYIVDKIINIRVPINDIGDKFILKFNAE